MQKTLILKNIVYHFTMQKAVGLILKKYSLSLHCAKTIILKNIVYHFTMKKTVVLQKRVVLKYIVYHFTTVCKKTVIFKKYI